jgi:hypothetical protein
MIWFDIGTLATGGEYQVQAIILLFLFSFAETNPSTGCGWADAATNCAFMQSLANAAAANGVNWGTYASEYMWTSIMGGCTVGGGNPLWVRIYTCIHWCVWLLD